MFRDLNESLEQFSGVSERERVRGCLWRKLCHPWSSTWSEMVGTDQILDSLHGQLSTVEENVCEVEKGCRE